jgi:hypothetical protein
VPTHPPGVAAMLALLVLLVVAGLATGAAVPALASHAPNLAAPHGSTPTLLPPPALTAARPMSGSSSNQTIGPVYASTDISPGANPVCFDENFSPSYDDFCLHETQNPTILTLANGDLGLGYSIYTTVGPTCPPSAKDPLPGWTTSNVAWARSTTRGATWGPATLVGTTTCRWPSSSEPTFARGDGSAVYGAFVLSNQSVNVSKAMRQPALPPDWSNTTGDAIGFVSSSNNGKNWTPVRVLPNITGAARPVLAVFGTTIYLAYVFDPDTTALYPTGGFLAVSLSSALAVDLVYSSDAGATWHGPVTLPGENASMGNWSTSPSIAVNTTGGLAVAYATNRTCVEYCYFGPYSTFADDIVVATSDRNGSVWSGPVTVAKEAGEDPSDQEYHDLTLEGDEYPWQTPPTTSIAYGSPTDLYVAFAGAYAIPSTPYLSWDDMGVFASVSTNGGATWTTSTVAAPGDQSNSDDLYSPAVAVSGSTAYVVYVRANETYCNGKCNPLVGGYSSWIAASTNGVTWTNTYGGGLTRMSDPYEAERAWQGWVSSVTFSGGTPVTATTLPVEQSATHPTLHITDLVDRSNVVVGFATVGPTTYARFVAQNLTPGTTWGVAVDGYVRSTNASTLNITNVPLGVAIPVGLPPPPVIGYRVIESSVS